MRKFNKKRRVWINPDTFNKIMKMLTSKSDEDFEIAKNLLKSNQIKLTRWRLNVLEKQSGWYFNYNSGELSRSHFKNISYMKWVRGQLTGVYQFKMSYDIGEH